VLLGFPSLSSIRPFLTFENTDRLILLPPHVRHQSQAVVHGDAHHRRDLSVENLGKLVEEPRSLSVQGSGMIHGKRVVKLAQNLNRLFPTSLSRPNFAAAKAATER